jgi:hypothetical protein
MDLHRHTGEMIFSTLAKTYMAEKKLHVSLNNVQTQLKLEKVSSLEKDNKKKSLEELVLKMGYDSSNVKAIEDLIKTKNDGIASLRKRLKISTTEDLQAKYMAETEGQKEEMLNLIMEKNDQIKEMEVELDKLVKEKEKNVTMTFIPLNEFPIIGVSTIMTTSVTTREIPAATSTTAPNVAEKLAKVMEDMTRQGAEIRKLHEEIQNIQKIKSMFVRTRVDPGFNITTTHQQNPNYRPFWQHLRSR